MQTLPRPFEGLKVLWRATRPPGSSFQPRGGLHIEQRTYSISTGTGFWELSVIRFSTWGPTHMRWLMEQELEHRGSASHSKNYSRGYARKVSGWSVWKVPFAR
jgi:hypothetical protein